MIAPIQESNDRMLKAFQKYATEFSNKVSVRLRCFVDDLYHNRPAKTPEQLYDMEITHQV